MNFPDIPLLRINDINENLQDYEGKILLVVNVASNCGFTPQYADLQKLHEDFKGNNFVVLGFPCNQFGSQEPGNHKEIEHFCKMNFNVTFPLFKKTDVNGNNEHKIFTYLKSRAPGLLGTTQIKWNFTKFLIINKYQNIKRYAPQTPILEIRKDLVNFF